MRVVPRPKRKTQEDILRFFRARDVKFQSCTLKQELYRQLGLSSLLEPIQSVQDMTHEKSNLGLFMIVQTEDYLFKYQYRDSKITFNRGEFKTEREPLKKGFKDFDGDEIVSFLQYCIEDQIDFSILSSRYIDKNLLIQAK